MDTDSATKVILKEKQLFFSFKGMVWGKAPLLGFVFIQGVPEKIVHSKCLPFCVIALGLLRSQTNYLYFDTIEFIAVILSIIDFLRSNLMMRYEYDY